MHKPVILSRSPNKNNIFYDLREKGKEIETELDLLVKELCEFCTKTTKTIIFCRLYKDCGCLYQFFKSQLKDKLIDPMRFPDINPFRLVDMFKANNTVKFKNSILE